MFEGCFGGGGGGAAAAFFLVFLPMFVMLFSMRAAAISVKHESLGDGAVTGGLRTRRGWI